jgi:putative ABC transport system substrate-binding protein
VKRREFITFLSGAAVWPLVARADVSTKRPLIAVLRGGAIARIDNSPLSAFVQGLNELGYVDGLNADIVYRFAEEHTDRFPVLAAEVVGL